MESEFFLVGGAVRDIYLFNSLKEVNDFDYVIECPDFDTLVRKVKEEGFTAVPNAQTESGFVEFPEHLGLKAYDPNLECVVDIHCARKEFDYRDRRHPAIVEPGSIQQDIERRDFTCNGLLLSRDKFLGQFSKEDIIDLHKGIEHIDHGILVCIGDPVERFSENPDRIVRLFRFACKYNWDLSIDIQSTLFQPSVINLLERENDDVKVKSLNKIFRDKECLFRFLSYMSCYRLVSHAIFSNVGLMATNRSEYI